MNNYSLGGFDPSLVEQIYNYVQPSPFATSAMRDPSLVGQTSEMLTRLSYPNDKLAPPTYSDVSMPSGQPEHDALDVIGAIFKAPFRLIGAAKNGLEEAIGHPNADKRAMQDEFVRQRELAILASNAVSQQEKQMLFPDAYAQDRQAIAAAQTGGDARATGRNTGDYPLPQPRKIGMSEWFFGDEQKMRNEQMARIKAFEALIAQKQEEAQARYKQEELRGKQIANEKGQWDLTLGYAYDDTDRLLAQDVQRTNIEQGKASTALSYASIGNMAADNERANRTEARLAAGAGDAKTLAELRVQTAQERLRAMIAKNASQSAKDALGPFGDATGYDSQGGAFDLNKAVAQYNAASTEAEKQSVLARYGLGTKRVGGTDLPIFGNVGGNDIPDWEAARARRPASATAGLIKADTNHPRYTQFYNETRKVLPAADEAKVKNVALQALQAALDAGK